MKEAAKHFIGEHDFAGFCSAGSQVKSTVRTIYDLQVIADRNAAGEIHIRVTGNGFLYNMVRIIAGTLIEVGKGYITPEEIPVIIESRERRKAGPTAPAHGLKLVEIRYNTI